MQQPPGLLGDGLEDRLGLGPEATSVATRRSADCSSASSASASCAPASSTIPISPSSSPNSVPEIGIRRSPPTRTRRGAPRAGEHRPDLGRQRRVLEHAPGLHARGHRERGVGVHGAQRGVEAPDRGRRRVEQPAQRRGAPAGACARLSAR